MVEMQKLLADKFDETRDKFFHTRFVFYDTVRDRLVIKKGYIALAFEWFDYVLLGEL